MVSTAPAAVGRPPPPPKNPATSEVLPSSNRAAQRLHADARHRRAVKEKFRFTLRKTASFWLQRCRNKSTIQQCTAACCRRSKMKQ
ncbi:unnamed protein product [Symbiodinium microadriaticum]|nr:unnamed protein product [Symbiodinium microadriaticum]